MNQGISNAKQCSDARNSGDADRFLGECLIGMQLRSPGEDPTSRQRSASQCNRAKKPNLARGGGTANKFTGRQPQLGRCVSRWNRVTWTPLFLLCLILSVLRVAQAEDPCATAKQRALVLSGGGVKGAFEAGAVYHLVVQRGCDFSEFSGVSVGALNAAFLAQARQAEAPRDSYADLANQTEALVSLWQSLRSSQDIARGRPLARGYSAHRLR